MRSPRLYPVTTDGIRNIVFNGVPDWVYEGKIIYGMCGVCMRVRGHNFPTEVCTAFFLFHISPSLLGREGEGHRDDIGVQGGTMGTAISASLLLSCLPV